MTTPTTDNPATHVTVTPGEVKVAYVDLTLDLGAAKAWEIGLDTKHAEIFGISGGTIYLGVGDLSFNPDGTRKSVPTSVTVNVPDDWAVTADCARYTARIFAHQRGDSVPCNIGTEGGQL